MDRIKICQKCKRQVKRWRKGHCPHCGHRELGGGVEYTKREWRRQRAALQKQSSSEQTA